MSAAESVVGFGRLCLDCGWISMQEAPGPVCTSPTHWRIYCNTLSRRCDELKLDRGRLLRALRWTVTATAFLPGGSLRRELLRRGVKKLLERARLEGW